MKQGKRLFVLIIICSIGKNILTMMEDSKEREIKEFQEITKVENIQTIEKPMESYSKEELKQQYENEKKEILCNSTREEYLYKIF